MTARSRFLVALVGLGLSACAGGGGGDGGAVPPLGPAREGWTTEEREEGLSFHGLTRAQLYARLVAKARGAGFSSWARDFDRHLDLRCEMKCEVLEHNTWKQENVK